jgi:hypothetical protein
MTPTGSLSSVLNASMFSGILTELVAIVAIMLPAMAGFWAFRKGIAFVQKLVRKA